MYAMQAIQTTNLGPRSTHGARVSAKCGAGSIRVAYDHAFNNETNHRMAAQALAEKLDWVGDNYGRLECGGLADGSYVHMFSSGANNHG